MIERIPKLLIIITVLFVPGLAASAQPIQGEPSFVALREARVPITSLIRTPFVPVRIFEVSAPEQVIAGEPALFTAAVNVRNVTLPVEAEWSLGDGTMRSGLSVEHAFQAPGIYEVTFRMANARSSEERTMVVEVVAEATAEPDAH